jgi:hypothetical protein
MNLDPTLDFVLNENVHWFGGDQWLGCHSRSA